MGFRSYTDYLKSSLWSWIRARVLVRDRERCVKCGGVADSVHHASYSGRVLAGEDLEWLVSVCDGCHERAERLEDGSKTSLAAANARLGVSSPPAWDDESRSHKPPQSVVPRPSWFPRKQWKRLNDSDRISVYRVLDGELRDDRISQIIKRATTPSNDFARSELVALRAIASARRMLESERDSKSLG